MFINILKATSTLVIASITFAFAFSVSSITTFAAPAAPLMPVNNLPLQIGISDNKTIARSNLMYDSNGVYLEYGNASYINTPGQNNAYITLSYNGTNTYPASKICVDGIAVNETQSGSGMFPVDTIMSISSGIHYLWIPYIDGDCSFWYFSQGYFTTALYPDESVILNVNVVPVSTQEIFYTLNSIPTRATLNINGQNVDSTNYSNVFFTQNDIDNGKVKLTTNNSVEGVDSFDFMVTDLSYYYNSTYSFYITNPKILGGTTVNFPNSTSGAASNQTVNPTSSANPTTTPVTVQPQTQPVANTVVAQVINNQANETSDPYVYGLKGVSASANKPISLDARARVSRTSGTRTRNYSFTLTGVRRIDPELKDLNCELVSTNNGDTVLATAKLDQNGRCQINWIPGRNFSRGRTSVYIKIVDTKRGHTYTSRIFNLNLR